MEQQKKKIAIVSNTSWSVYNFRLGLIRRIQELGHEVSVIAPRDNFSAKLVADGFNFHHLYTNNYSTNPINDFRTLRQLRKIYKKNKFDFIFHYTIKPNIYGTLAAKWVGIPSIAITTGLGRLFAYNNIIVKFLSKLLYSIACSYSQQIWFLNESDRETFVKRGIASKNKTYILPSEGVDVQRFKPKDTYTKNRSNSKITFLFAGRIIWDKGVREFIEAAQIIKEKYRKKVNFQILGFIDPSNPNAVPYEYIQKWQRKRVISYLGETEDVRSFIDEATCLIFPSFYNEGISRILLETAAMGKPIITTHNVGCKDVVKNNYNGYLCKPRNTKDLVQKIEKFIALSPKEIDLMGLNGRKVILENFNEEIIIKKYINYLDSFFNLQKEKSSKKKITLS